eukprot:2740542-Prymnesium_polylepis.1
MPPPPVVPSPSAPPPEPPTPPPPTWQPQCHQTCFDRANPSLETGEGFEVYVPACAAWGGYGCVAFTGCRLCEVKPPYTYGECPPLSLIHISEPTRRS